MTGKQFSVSVYLPRQHMQKK